MQRPPSNDSLIGQRRLGAPEMGRGEPRHLHKKSGRVTALVMSTWAHGHVWEDGRYVHSMGMSPELTPINLLMFPPTPARSVYGEQVLLAHLKRNLKHTLPTLGRA